MKKESTRFQDIIHSVLLYGVMMFYLFLLFLLLFCKKEAGSFQSVNLLPFRTIHSYLYGDRLFKSFAFINIAGNIVIFIPLGVYISLLNQKKRFLNIPLIILISTIVEILQFVFKVGATDIDDVILNSVGGLIGVILFRIVNMIFKDKTKIAVEFIAIAGGIFAFAILIIINM